MTKSEPLYLRVLLVLGAAMIWSAASANPADGIPLPTKKPGEFLIASPLISPGAKSVIEGKVRDAYRSLGIEVKFFELPLRRIPLEFQAGRLDAMVGSLLPDFSKTSAGTRKVNVPVMNITVAAFSRGDKSNLAPASWQTLGESDTRVAAVCGAAHIAKYLPNKKIECTSSLQNLIRMLMLGRIDYAVAIRGSFEEAFTTYSKEPDAGALSEIRTTVLSVDPAYHYVHERHAKLIPGLERYFKQHQSNPL